MNAVTKILDELKEFIVVVDSYWHSGECKTYLKGETVRLPAGTKTNKESSVQPKVVAPVPAASQPTTTEPTTTEPTTEGTGADSLV